MFSDSWLYRPISVDHFHHLFPAEGELALLQVNSEVQYLRDTMDKSTRLSVNGLDPHTKVNYLEKFVHALGSPGMAEIENYKCFHD